MNFGKLLFRAWFYFRQGYNVYLAFLIGFASNIVVLFRLGVEPNSYLHPFAPTLSIFVIEGLAVAIPAGIIAGLYHMKRTAAYAADASVAMEANPYVYKTIGKEKEVFIPLWILTVKALTKILQKETMTQEDKKEVQDVLDKAAALLDGQSLGVPKHFGVRTFPITDDDK